MLAFAAVSPVHAAFISNGGFEAGFAGWTRTDKLGSDGTFLLQTGTTSPVNGDPVPAPPQGTTAAMTDAQGPGSHVLYQDIFIPAPVASAMLTFQLFIGNRADRFATPNTLDFSTPALNQQARVDITTTSADAFSLAPGDIVLNAYVTNVGDPLVSGYTSRTVDITGIVNSNVGQSLRIRFAEVDNIFTFQLGVDDVDIITSEIPEPATWMTALSALAMLRIARRRRQ
jgi:hypothetical protein